MITDGERFEDIFRKYAAIPGSEPARQVNKKHPNSCNPGVMNFPLTMNGGIWVEAGSGRFAAV
jgi:hypothetical protein